MTEPFQVRTRLYLPEAGQKILVCDDSETRSIAKVLRLAPGDDVVCFNGDGIEYLYRVERAGRSGIMMTLRSSWPNVRDPRLENAVWIASSKGKSKEEAARSLTALGVTRIVFFQAERSVSKPESRVGERLRKIAVETCRQCGRSTVPNIHVYNQSLQDLFRDGGLNSSGILFWEQTPDAPISITRPNAPLEIVFGPEGGFTQKEIDWAIDYGFTLAGLGPRILRAELAVIVGVALVQNLRGMLCKHVDKQN